ncbi:hypothetical protein [Nonomuraea endophytica]|uniref:hypothetical protein n=1 Tax=Nonomuraea endophytica TaxID=714136 RepID=UPI0037C7F5C4
MDQDLVEAAVTMDAAAHCSSTSLRSVFGNRDGLQNTMFDRYVPVPDPETMAYDPPSGSRRWSRPSTA